ncbi:DUF6531 domain-containing protein [Streptomyces sp. NPDC057939]|uniref:DUF6531 domain-containing protein n=1 Tax=Streptomyces sp. NPDC057939 TaxID=3346284 RepID=UPI0036ECE0FA
MTRFPHPCIGLTIGLILSILLGATTGAFADQQPVRAIERTQRVDFTIAPPPQQPMTLQQRRKQVSEDNFAASYPIRLDVQEPVPGKPKPVGKSSADELKYRAGVGRAEIWDSSGRLRAAQSNRDPVVPRYVPKDGEQLTLKYFITSVPVGIGIPSYPQNVSFKFAWACALDGDPTSKQQIFYSDPISITAPSIESGGIPVTHSLTYRESMCSDLVKENEAQPRPKPYQRSMNFTTTISVQDFDNGGNYVRWGLVDGSYLVGSAFPELPTGQTLGSKCGGNAASASRCSGSHGAGVNTSTGAFSQHSTDLSIPGGFPVDISRDYSSNNPHVGALGIGWSGSWDSHLRAQSDGSLVFESENGSEYLFTRNPDGQFTAPAGVDSGLRKVAGGYELTSRAGETLAFDAAGNLAQRVDKQQRKVTYDYTAGRLTSLRTDLGRKASFSYAENLLTDVTLWDGRKVSYRYSGGRLTSFIGLDGRKVDYNYDSSGRIQSVTQGGEAIQNVYDGAGRVIEQTIGLLKGKITFSYNGDATDVTMPDGGIWTDVHAKNVLQAQYDPFGNKTSFEYSFKLDRVAVVDPLGSRFVTAFDSAGRPVEAQGPHTSSRYSYGSDGVISLLGRGEGQWSFRTDTGRRLTETRDPLGSLTRYTYTAAGQIKSVTRPAGGSTVFEYDADGNQTSVTTASGGRETRTFDPSGRLRTVTDPRGNAPGVNPAQYTTAYVYDSADRIISVVDPKGGATLNSYDASGNLHTVTDPAGRITEHTYDLANRRTSTKSPGGATEWFTYNNMGQLSSRTDAAGAKTTYTYDKAGRLITLTAPRGNVAGADPARFTWKYVYDKVGNRISSTDPAGNVRLTSYDKENRPISMTDPIGNIALSRYDGADNLVETTDALGKKTVYTYNAANQMTAVKDPNGNTLTYTYDSDGNRITETSPLGFKATYSYDVDGRPVARTEPRGNLTGADPARFTWRTGYDAAGNAISETDPLGNSITNAYDALNNLIERNDPQGKKTSYTYDELNRMVQTNAPDGGVTKMTFHSSGNLATRTDANQRTTAYEYDKTGRLTKVTDPLNRVTQYSYDVDGNRDKVTNARGQTITSLYDSRNLLTSSTYSDGTPKVSYAYDNAGQPTTITDATGTRSITYDKTGRPLTISAPGSANPFKYTYGANGLVSSRTYPNGRATSYAYDADGRITAQTQNGRTTTYGWDQAGNLLTTVVPTTPATTESRTYDQAGRMASISEGAGVRQFTRDGSGRVTAEQYRDATTTGYPKRYEYDNTGRVTRACSDVATNVSCLPGTSGESYTYDKVGNRLTATTGATTTTNIYDVADQLTRSTTGGATTDFTYDADGNQVKDVAGTYTYDALGRVKSNTVGADTFTFAYDADGNRTATKKNGALQRSTQWDVNTPIPRAATDLSATGALLSDYHYGPLGEPQSLDTSTSSFFYLHDRQNSITAVRDLNNVDTYKYSYGTWGNVIGTAGGGTQQRSSFGYNGTIKDPFLTGRTQLPARSYDAKTGRFTTPDPRPDTAQPTNTSTYAYANNDPVNQSDPSGACPLCVSAGIGAAFGAVVEGGIYTWQHRNGGFTASGLGRAAGRGAVVGGVAGLLMPGAGNVAARGFGLTGGRALATSTAVNAGVGAGFSYAVNEAYCRPTDPSDLLIGATGGAGSSLIGPAWNGVRGIWSRGTAANPSAVAAEGPVTRLLYGARRGEGLPGSAGVKIDRRPTVTELENMTVKHDVEFAVVYELGPGRGGRGGQYTLYSGQVARVKVPVTADSILVYHTHPRGTPSASDADKALLELFEMAGSPMRSSKIIPVGSGGVVTTFTKNGTSEFSEWQPW